MKARLAIIFASLLLLAGCNDNPPSSVVLDPLPEPIPSVHIIETYYHVQFTWGRGQNVDTITMEIPDEEEKWDEPETHYFNFVSELRSEVIKRPNELDSTILDTVGWAYGPAAICYPYEYAVLNLEDEEFPENIYEDQPDPLVKPGGNEEDKQAVYKNIFWMSFPWRVRDTIQFWDKEDYRNNPFIVEDFIQWGRLGNNITNDSLFNDDQRNGVVLHFIDDRGTVWESDNPPTFQITSYFKIDDRQENFRDGLSDYIIEGEMAARLYNQFGEYKELRNGVFRLRIMDDIVLSEQPK